MELLQTGVELLKSIERIEDDQLWSEFHAHCSVELKQFAQSLLETQESLEAVEKTANNLVGKS